MTQSADTPDSRRTHMLDRAVEARTRLLELVANFPFAVPAGAAAWLAGLLTVVGRSRIDGPTPLFIVSGRGPGLGKSTLCNLTAIIATGQRAPFIDWPSRARDQEARVVSVTVAACPMVVIDNPVHEIGGSALLAALTSTELMVRKPGTSTATSQRMSAVWWASARKGFRNPPNEILRRALWIELAGDGPRSGGWTAVEDVCNYAAKNRGQLFADAIAILDAQRAFRNTAGDVWGSYEGWCRTVRGAVLGVGMQDPLVLTRGS